MFSFKWTLLTGEQFPLTYIPSPLSDKAIVSIDKPSVGGILDTPNLPGYCVVVAVTKPSLTAVPPSLSHSLASGAIALREDPHFQVD